MSYRYGRYGIRDSNIIIKIPKNNNLRDFGCLFLFIMTDFTSRFSLTHRGVGKINNSLFFFFNVYILFLYAL